jgi:hypothetical protein
MAAAAAVESQLRAAMFERDMLLRSRFESRALEGHGGLALLTPTGRVLVQQPATGITEQRLDVPPGGGEVALESGLRAFAEPVGHEQAFVLRALDQQQSAGRPASVLRVNLIGRDRAEIELRGSTIRLSRRHSEILALLMMRPAGFNSEELAAELYGDAGRPGSVRVEISRMRSSLGDSIETEPYRLAGDVESDVGRLRGLLDRGAIRAAAECYEGPLLPDSDAPGIAREREALDTWVRQAVMTGEDDDALWAWVQSRSGAEDLPAWKRLLGRLAFHDPRRSLAASHVAALRARFAT